MRRGIVSIIAAAMLLSALTFQDATRTAQGASAFQGTLNVYLQSHTPGIQRPGGLPPLKAVSTLAQQWEALHPGVTIKFVAGPPPGADPHTYAAWVISHQQSNTIPELIFQQGEPLDSQLQAKPPLWVPLDSYLSKPNPYAPAGTPGAKQWINGFSCNLSYTRSVNGHIYLVPLTSQAVLIYVNVALLKKAGIPLSQLNNWTWDDMLRISAKVAKAGIIPWAVSATAETNHWFMNIWWNGAIDGKLRKKIDLNHDGVVDGPEFIKAWNAGTIDYRKGAKAIVSKGLQMYKDWWQYAAPGALTLSGTNQNALFLQGKTAFDFDGIWDLGLVKQASKFANLQYAVVPFPSMAKQQESVGGSANAYWPGGCSDLYAITSEAQKRGDTALAVDFLQYLTSPQNESLFIQEEDNALPASIGAQPATDMALAEPKPGQGFLYTQFTETDEGPRVPIFQQWLSSQQDLNTTIDQLATLEDQWNAQQ